MAKGEKSQLQFDAANIMGPGTTGTVVNITEKLKRTSEPERGVPRETSKVTEESPLINCLRPERVFVKFIKRDTLMVGKDTKHILQGGMAEGSSFTVAMPKQRSGAYKNVLTDSEKTFLEHILGRSLSIYERPETNYWRNLKMRLTKGGEYLDLSVPRDYIMYKVLLANDKLICPSLKDLEERPKETYRFVLTSDSGTVTHETNKMKKSLRASEAFSTIIDDRAALQYVAEFIKSKPISESSTTDYIKTEAFKAMQESPDNFIAVVEDPLFKTKVLMKECLKAGILRKSGENWFTEANAPLANPGGEPTLDVAAAFLNLPINQSLKLTIEEKLRKYKEKV